VRKSIIIIIIIVIVVIISGNSFPGWAIVARLKNKPTLLGQTVGSRWETTHQ